MGFWIFMLIMELLIPVLMIVIGAVFSKHAPREINMLLGYRTARSMKNRDTWEFAHRHCGRVWFLAGWILLPLSALPLFFVMGRGEDVVGTVGSIVTLVEVAVMIACIFPTELALRKRFNSDGSRKSK